MRAVVIEPHSPVPFESGGSLYSEGSQTMDPLEVTFKLNDDDIMAAQWHCVMSSPSLREQYRRTFALVPMIVLGVLILFVAFAEWSLLFCGWLFVFSTVLWFLQWPRIYRDNLKRATKKLLKEGRNELLRRTVRLEIDEGGLHVTSGMGESRLSWDAVERVEETADHIFIYVTSLSSHVIPKWAFESRGQAEQFFVKAAECQRRAAFS
jgi:hypothetical protein